MPRVTKVILESNIEYLRGLLSDRDHKIELLEEKVKLLNSPMSGPGQLTVQLITIQRLSEALTHVLSDLKSKP